MIMCTCVAIPFVLYIENIWSVYTSMNNNVQFLVYFTRLLKEKYQPDLDTFGIHPCLSPRFEINLNKHQRRTNICSFFFELNEKGPINHSSICGHWSGFD